MVGWGSTLTVGQTFGVSLQDKGEYFVDVVNSTKRATILESFKLRKEGVRWIVASSMN